MSDRTIKAKRATIEICSNVQLEALEMPDGEFRLSLTSAAEAVGFTRQWLSLVTTAKRPETVKALEGKGFRRQHILLTRIEKKGRGGASSVKSISLNDFDAILDYGVEQKNPKAIALNRALRRVTLIDLIRTEFGYGQMTVEEKRAIFYKTYAASLSYEDWLEMDREDIRMIEEQLRFIGELD